MLGTGKSIRDVLKTFKAQTHRLYQVHVLNKYVEYKPVVNQKIKQYEKAMKRQDASRTSSAIQGRIDKFHFPKNEIIIRKGIIVYNIIIAIIYDVYLNRY